MLSAIRHLDVPLATLALPVFLVAGLPLAGWGVGAGAWAAQRGLQLYLERRAKAAKDPRTVVGVLAGSMIARGWLVAIAVFLVGASDNEAGLCAAVLVIALFTVYFTVRMVLRPFEIAPASRTSSGAREDVSDRAVAGGGAAAMAGSGRPRGGELR